MAAKDRVVTALIPARGGSKGLPGKNIRPFHGRPLLAWTIEAARACEAVGAVVVSTDDPAIAEVATDWGALVERRPAELATDTASTADVVRHHLEAWRMAGRRTDVVALLQPTSPLRTAHHVEAALRQFEDEALDSLASCTLSPAHPYLTWRLERDRLEAFIPDAPVARRQDLPPAFVLNGALYLFRAAAFPATGDSVLYGVVGGYVMDPAVSIDIDDLEDFQAAEAVAASQGGGPHQP
jgi:CMP-N,N'-diacetyllegionaminic acid synthase